MQFVLNLGGLVLLLFLGMLICLNIGYRIGRKELEKKPELAKGGMGTLDAAIFGLLGLILAFTFSGAASGFEARRHLIVEEANAIGTAYLRLDLLPQENRKSLQEKFRRYVVMRLSAYEKLPDIAAALAEVARSETMQQEIWTEAVQACRTVNYQPAGMLLLPALNAMIDITTARTAVTRFHPPTVIFVLLFVLAILSSLIAGYGMASVGERKWLYILIFSAVISITVYVICDLEFPRLGLIRVDPADKLLIDLLTKMGEAAK